MINEDKIKVKRKQIDRYQGYVTLGEGHIRDCQTDEEIITIDFRSSQDKLAEEIFKTCIIALNTFESEESK